MHEKQWDNHGEYVCVCVRMCVHRVVIASICEKREERRQQLELIQQSSRSTRLFIFPWGHKIPMHIFRTDVRVEVLHLICGYMPDRPMHHAIHTHTYGYDLVLDIKCNLHVMNERL